MLKNIFLVRSPLQIINAIEAKEHFKLNNTLLVMMFNKSHTNTKQMKDTMKLSSWDEVIVYEPNRKKSALLEQVKLIKKLKKDKYGYLFSGDFGTINKALIANLEVGKIYLVDDGTAAIIIHEKLYKKKKEAISKKLKLVRYSLFGLKYRIKQRVNFFTCFNLEKLGEEEIVINRYSHLQTHYLQRLEKDDKTYLLGQNLTEANYMDDKTYVSYIKKVIERYDGDIIYMPHRAEIISDDLKALENDNFVFRENKGPIELMFIEKGIYPFRIISFFSSALFTLDRIFPDTSIEALNIKDNDLLSGKDKVRSAYSFFNGTGIKLVDL